MMLCCRKQSPPYSINVLEMFKTIAPPACFKSNGTYDIYHFQDFHKSSPNHQFLPFAEIYQVLHFAGNFRIANRWLRTLLRSRKGLLLIPWYPWLTQSSHIHQFIHFAEIFRIANRWLRTLLRPRKGLLLIPWYSNHSNTSEQFPSILLYCSKQLPPCMYLAQWGVDPMDIRDRWFNHNKSRVYIISWIWRTQRNFW